MRSKDIDPDFVKSVHAFYDHLHSESERGSAIVGAALIDDALEELLKTFMVKSLEKEDELFNGSFAPLATLSAKITLSYRLGLISPKVHSSLTLVRKLRNDFAHVSRQITFETQSVHSRVRDLFNLNDHLLDLIWDLTKDYVDDVTTENTAKNGLDNLVMHIGWKSTYDILISIVAATLCEKKRNIPGIVSSHRD